MPRTKQTARKGTSGAAPRHQAAPSTVAKKQPKTTKQIRPPSPERPDNYDDTVYPPHVDRPSDIVHENLTYAWTVNRKNPMAFIFDQFSPSRKFKRGVVDDGKTDFASIDDGDVTDTALGVQFQPDKYTRRFIIEVDLCFDTFMSWEPSELRKISIGTRNKKSDDGYKWLDKHIPAPYDRVIHQLVAEAQLGEETEAHEAVRRQVYAERTLDGFCKEIKAYKGDPVSFRSKLLTPLLVRQLNGVDDGYTPSVQNAIHCLCPHKEKIDIYSTTSFYLTKDPCSTIYIPAYRRHLLYLPTPRWHLGILMGVDEYLGGPLKHFELVIQNHDKVMTSLLGQLGVCSGGPDPPLLSEVEVDVIRSELLTEFFLEELSLVPEYLDEQEKEQLVAAGVVEGEPPLPNDEDEPPQPDDEDEPPQPDDEDEPPNPDGDKGEAPGPDSDEDDDEEEESDKEQPKDHQPEHSRETQGGGTTQDEGMGENPQEIQPGRSRQAQSGADGTGELTKDLPLQEQDGMTGMTSGQPTETGKGDGDDMEVDNSNQ